MDDEDEAVSERTDREAILVGGVGKQSSGSVGDMRAQETRKVLVIRPIDKPLRERRSSGYVHASDPAAACVRTGSPVQGRTNMRSSDLALVFLPASTLSVSCERAYL